MKKRQAKNPYFMFTYIVVLNLSVLAMAIAIYLCMRISAANQIMSLVVLGIPVIAAIFVFYNIIAHFLELKGKSKAKEL